MHPHAPSPLPAHPWLGLLVLLAVCFAVAAQGALATNPNIPGWYAGLKKPSWNPPNWIFGPVWTLLYASMAVAAWLVWRQHGWRAAAVPLTLFAVQLALNGAWSWFFFARHALGAAFAEVVLLWAAIAATMAGFWPLSPPAALLLAPYLAWVTFASALNFAVWRLNV